MSAKAGFLYEKWPFAAHQTIGVKRRKVFCCRMRGCLRLHAAALALGSQSDKSSKAAIQCALPPSHIRHVIAQAIVFATNSPTEQIQHPCGVTPMGGGFHG